MPASPSRLQQLVLSEVIRRHEERHGLLADEAANVAARQPDTGLAARIQTRALCLARAGGQLKTLEQWLAGARVAFIVLIIVAVITGAGFAVAALGDSNRQVNLAWALGCLLGLNIVSLALWLFTLTVRQPHLGSVLSRCWLAISRRLGGRRRPESAPALTGLLNGQAASRWLFAVLTHLWWLLALTSAAFALFGLLVIRRYTFAWETTLLSPETFVTLTQGLSRLPALLGFALPDEATIRAAIDAVNAGQARHAWSTWLLSVLIVYGVAPRLILALFSAYRWDRAKAALALDLNQPGYAVLRERLAPSMERLGISDPEIEFGGPGTRTPSATMPGGALCVAIELDDSQGWPPPLPAGVNDGGVLDTREERQAVRDQLARAPVERLLVACDPRRSPDRGTLVLIRDLATGAKRTRVWLMAPTAAEVDPLRVADWHAALKTLALTATVAAPWHWLETGHE